MDFQGRRKNFGRRTVSPILVGIFFLFLLLVSENSSLSQAAKENSGGVLAQFSKSRSSFLQVFKGLGKVFSPEEVLEESKVLREENRRLEEQVTHLLSLKEENQTLRAMIRQQSISSIFANAKLVKVLGSSPRRPKELLYFTGGRELGIGASDIVILPERTLIGKVSEVRNSHALAETLFNSDLRITVRIGENAEGLFLGGQKPKVSLIPEGSSIKTGDLVITSGEDGNFPRGLVLGEVAEILSRTTEPFGEVIVRLPFNISNLETLTVIKNPLQ
ncbi:MAG: rod shape-determining protein MreC [Parcubacteria group bacterium]|nr:rod shape-determining protein MreC [Parcubacteria group bacterium]